MSLKTGKLFGKIGYGESQKKDPLFEFKAPPFPWITSEYVEKNAWAICSCDKDRECPGAECDYIVRSDKVIPCFPRRFLKPRDVLIHLDYEEGERFEELDEFYLSGKKVPIIIDRGENYEELDRYQLITEETLEIWEEEGLGSPEAVVVRPPDKPVPKPERIITRIIKRYLKKVPFFLSNIGLINFLRSDILVLWKKFKK